jgi:hypothetical protein
MVAPFLREQVCDAEERPEYFALSVECFLLF